MSALFVTAAGETRADIATAYGALADAADYGPEYRQGGHGSEADEQNDPPLRAEIDRETSRDYIPNDCTRDIRAVIDLFLHVLLRSRGIGSR